MKLMDLAMTGNAARLDETGAVRLSGCITSASVSRVMTLGSAMLLHPRAKRVLNLVGAELALPIDQMGAASAGCRLSRDEPTAIVVRPDQLCQMREFAWRMSQRGRLRGVFLCPAEALRWAMDQRAVWASLPDAPAAKATQTSPLRRWAFEALPAQPGMPLQ